jgi:hypothetical protein
MALDGLASSGTKLRRLSADSLRSVAKRVPYEYRGSGAANPGRYTWHQ